MAITQELLQESFGHFFTLAMEFDDNNKVVRRAVSENRSLKFANSDAYKFKNEEDPPYPFKGVSVYGGVEFFFSKEQGGMYIPTRRMQALLALIAADQADDE